MQKAKNKAPKYVSKNASKGQKFIFLEKAYNAIYATVINVGNNLAKVFKVSIGVLWQNQNITIVCINKKARNITRTN
ncbi:MAG: hypothetical protein II183_01120, partial [Elusimicrobiaceae bacterium]|nr:hypothetical protein [Elusimicrobiaceae bacterium]